VKKIGCSNLKTLIEGDKLLINDFDTYSELTTFVAQKNSFSAEEDANDDLVMTLVIFSWVATQKYFKEIVNHDLRKQIQLENMNQVDEESLPAPIIEDGLEHDFEIYDGDVWEKADSGQIYSNFIKKTLQRM
ncbi:terminase, partial [bacterium]|nr:terminase [bacterium]